MSEMNIGSIESQEKGSGARANAGKPRWELMPLSQIVWLLFRDVCVNPLDPNLTTKLEVLVNELSYFQRYADAKAAQSVLKHSFMYLREQLNTDFTGTCEEIIRVWEHGEKKYASFNWMKGMPWSSVVGAYMRHIQWLLKGEAIDKESGLHHGAHLVCNAMMMVHFVEYYPDGNDLPVKWFT